MRRNLIVIIVLMTIVCTSEAQVYIQTTLPTVGLVQKNQLWNLLLINGATMPIEGKLELVLRDRQTGMELLTATTTRITLPKGSLSVNVNSLNPVQYNYLGMEPGNTLNGLLPAGAYVACYSFTKVTGEKTEQLTEECASFDIEPLSPPLLIFPADSSELETVPAQFTWTPPTPAGMVSHLQYEILITQVRPGQKADEAMQDNMSFYNSANVPVNYLTYPGTLPAFEKDKWYGWQVVARDNKSYAGKSEVWVFKVKQPEAVSSMVEMTPFVKLKTENTDQSIAPDGFLKIAYTNESGDSTATVELLDLSDQSADYKKDLSFTVPVKPGENFIQYNLKKILGRPDEGKIYQAVIRNSRGEKWMMRFVIRYFGK